MVVLVVLVLAFVLFRDLNRSDPPSPVRAVEYVQAAEFAREQASFDLVAPASLPEGWRATTVEYVPGSDDLWHLGLLTDEDRYVGLEQADASAESLVEAYVDDAAVRGEPVEIDGERWTTWTDEGGDLALVRRAGETTTLVVGHRVPQETLVAFIQSLR